MHEASRRDSFRHKACLTAGQAENHSEKKEKQKPCATRSSLEVPLQVLLRRHNVAWLPRADGMGHFLRAMSA